MRRYLEVCWLEDTMITVTTTVGYFPFWKLEQSFHSDHYHLTKVHLGKHGIKYSTLVKTRDGLIFNP